MRPLFTCIFALFVSALAAPPLPARVAGLARPPGPSPSQATRTVTDEVGRQVAIPAQVNRIVSLAPNLTEILYALAADSRLVGDTNYCDTPAAAKSKPHVGDPKNPSLEAIAALHPDLVLASASINRVETADALAHVGIPVFTSADPQTVRQLLDSIVRTGDVIGSPTQGASVAAALRARLDALQARLADRPLAHVLFVVWLDPLQSIGQRTFIADALRWAGAESVVLSDQLWPRITFEEVVRLQPDYIVLVGDHSGVNADDLADLRARPGWKDLNAVRLGRVVTMSEEVNRPSPGLIDAIEQLAHDLHPEAFSSWRRIAPGPELAAASSLAQRLTCAR